MIKLCLFEVLFIQCVEDEQNYLWEYIENHTDTGTLLVEIPRNIDTAARTAELSDQNGNKILKPPKIDALEHLAYVSIDVVNASEDNPPSYVYAVKW